MAYNEKLSDRIRGAMAGLKKVEEKYMFGGVCYMLNKKMCVGVVKDEMMCRINPDVYEQALEKKGCREMIFTPLKFLRKIVPLKMDLTALSTIN